MASARRPNLIKPPPAKPGPTARPKQRSDDVSNLTQSPWARILPLTSNAPAPRRTAREAAPVSSQSKPTALCSFYRVTKPASADSQPRTKVQRGLTATAAGPTLLAPALPARAELEVRPPEAQSDSPHALPPHQSCRARKSDRKKLLGTGLTAERDAGRIFAPPPAGSPAAADADTRAESAGLVRQTATSRDVPAKGAKPKSRTPQSSSSFFENWVASQNVKSGQHDVVVLAERHRAANMYQRV